MLGISAKVYPRNNNDIQSNRESLFPRKPIFFSPANLYYFLSYLTTPVVLMVRGERESSQILVSFMQILIQKVNFVVENT